MKAAPNSHDEATRWLLSRWEVDRAAAVARVAGDLGLSALVVREVLDLVFDNLATGDPEPARGAARRLFDAEQEQERRRNSGGNSMDSVPRADAPVAIHLALVDTFRASLETLPAPVAVGALFALSLGVHTFASAYADVAQASARATAERRTAELERALASLSSAQETLLQQARLKAMGSLADGVAHDVNNALNAVLLRTMLLTRQADPQAKKHLASIESVVRSAAATVQRLQEFSRRRDSRSRAACDPTAVAREAVEMTRQQWTHRAQREGDFIEVRVLGEGLPPVQADPGELRAILVDLVLNAIEAITEKGVIEIFVRAVGEFVEIEVTDNGPGIPPEHLRRVFEPFFTTRGPRSSGLGLAMAWGVMNRLGGEIKVANRPQGGASFTLVVPCAEVTDAPRRIPQGTGTHNLLLVDDDADGRETLQQVLVLRGYQVDVAADGNEALALYRMDLHDAVICDVSMPKMNGLQLARAIRGRNPQARIALLTGWNADVADGERGLVDAVFQKPVDVDAVVRFLEKTEPASPSPPARDPS